MVSPVNCTSTVCIDLHEELHKLCFSDTLPQVRCHLCLEGLDIKLTCALLISNLQGTKYKLSCNCEHSHTADHDFEMQTMLRHTSNAAFMACNWLKLISLSILLRPVDTKCCFVCCVAVYVAYITFCKRQLVFSRTLLAPTYCTSAARCLPQL